MTWPSSLHKIAIIYRLLPDPGQLGVGGFLFRALQKVCNVTHFAPGEETEGYDHYLYIDDSPTSYAGPTFHPATYYAIDMVLPQLWFLQKPEQYLERIQKFDQGLVSSTVAARYCAEHDTPVKHIGFAADVDFHKPYDMPRTWDFIALWHNCGERVDASAQALLTFPGGKVAWHGGEGYAKEISSARCALNWLRGNLINMRVFEVMAIGTPLVTTRNPMMADYGFLENEHYLGFEGIDEMLEKIGWAIAHQDEALAMAAKARNLVLSNHTYDHRIQEIFI